MLLSSFEGVCPPYFFSGTIWLQNNPVVACLQALFLQEVGNIRMLFTTDQLPPLFLVYNSAKAGTKPVSSRLFAVYCLKGEIKTTMLQLFLAYLAQLFLLQRQINYVCLRLLGNFCHKAG